MLRICRKCRIEYDGDTGAPLINVNPTITCKEV